MKPCAACGFLTLRRLCHFCRRTFELIQTRCCVTCGAAVAEGDSVRVEGKCSECLSRNHPVSKGTRWLLKQAAAARYNERRRSDSPLPKTARKIAA